MRSHIHNGRVRKQCWQCRRSARFSRKLVLWLSAPGGPAHVLAAGLPMGIEHVGACGIFVEFRASGLAVEREGDSREE